MNLIIDIYLVDFKTFRYLLESLFYIKDFLSFGKGRRSGVITMIICSFSERAVTINESLFNKSQELFESRSQNERNVMTMKPDLRPLPKTN